MIQMHLLSVQILWMAFMKNIDDNNPSIQRKALIVLDDLIADIMANKNFQAMVKELFIRSRKLNISLVFQKMLD